MVEMSVLIAAALAVFVLPPPLGVAVVAGAILLEIAELALYRRYLHGRRVQTGAEALVDQAGEASTALDPVGRVRIRGESWRARTREPVRAGEPVRVIAVDGLTLEVEPGESPSGPGS
jgi:membrane-bound serine protease (ClpP class)